LGGGSRADGLNLAIRDYDGLIFLGRRTGAINDSDVVENEDRRIDGYEGSDIARLLRLGKRGGRKEQGPTQKQDTHPFTSRLISS
jgi:hypothetical protein